MLVNKKQLKITKKKPKQKTPKPFRIEGIPVKCKTPGTCRRCKRTGDLYGAITNQGYISICKDCVVIGRVKGKEEAPPPHEKQDRNDIMIRRLSGSFGSGKKR